MKYTDDSAAADDARRLNVKEAITKSDWLDARECLAKAWFRLHSAAAAPTEAELFRMQQGQDIGELARELYPKGIFVSKDNEKNPVEITQELIGDVANQTLFEATFRAGSFIAKVDILMRNDDSWHVLEVKSSFSNTSKIKQLIDDLAYTVFVLRRAGQHVTKASLVLLSRTFQFGEDADRLFEIVDKTEDVNAAVARFQEAAESIADTLVEASSPTRRLVPACRSCDFFGDKCLGSALEHTVLEIPGLQVAKLMRLSTAGIIDLSHVPKDLDLDDCQDRAKRAALSGNLVVERGLGAALESIKWPCNYLDFETVATFLPLYHGHGCHRQVLTQFSIHHRANIEAEPTHSEYLADASKDCERELAEALIEKLGDRGSIIVYSNFEETRIKALQNAFADLASRLQTILSRLVNLLPIVEDNVYHPDFRGSFSIKKVLPALVPELSYAKLDVADGDTAITRFARMARGEIFGVAVQATRQQLLDYCRMDTLAMVRLHETLHKLAVETQRAASG